MSRNAGPIEGRRVEAAPFRRKTGPSREMLAAVALNEEARSRRMTYGKLVGILTVEQQRAIVNSYIKRRSRAAE